MKRVFTPVKKKTILLIDDDQLIIQAHREKLQRHGFKVEVASNKASALQKLAEDGVVLVLLDLCLPGMSGVEILKEIRSKFEASALPIIAFVNPYLGNLARSALEAGATNCLTKADTSPGKLFDVVRERLTLESPSGAQVEPEFQPELGALLLLRAPEILAKLRASHQVLARTEEEEAQRAELRGLHQQVRALAVAGLAGLGKISQMANAFEALLIELHAKPKKITPSVIRTVAQAIDSLASLLEQATKSHSDAPTAPRILVVDDEIISRETICSALDKAGLAGVSMDDSLAAQRELEQEYFDLIFLDVEMPGLTGFELCKKIREMPINRTTPVVFVTAHADFGSRAQSALSGGNDFITKPFLSGELIVKALACLFKEKPRATINFPVASAPAVEELAIASSSAH
ncbi:MAG: response regulator [Verrucomicrobiota bacterium]|nr:response regulator [Verrucomicrobiota bacterium]